MLKRANMHRPLGNRLESLINAATKNGLEQMNNIASESQLLSVLLQRKFSTRWEVVLRKNKKLPKCIRKLMETLVQESRELEIMTGATQKLLEEQATFLHILSVMVSKGSLQERLSQFNLKESKKVSLRPLSSRRL